MQKGTHSQVETDFLSTESVPKCCQQLRLGQAKVKSLDGGSSPHGWHGPNYLSYYQEHPGVCISRQLGQK